MRLLNKNISTLGIIYIVSILAACLWMLVFGPIPYNDTPSYLNAYANNLAQGRLDTFRTPLYPLLLGWSSDLLGAKVFPWTIIVLQYALFLVSIKYFHLSAKRFLPECWALAATAFYAIYPTFSSWSNLLLTESLALSFSVYLTYSCFKLVLDKDGKSAIFVFIWLLLLLALRPASVAFLPALSVTFFICLFNRGKRKCSILGLTCIVAASCILLCYSAAIEKRTGLFTPSIVSVYNNYIIADEYGYLDHKIDLSSTDIQEIKALTDQSSRQNRKGWLAGLARRSYDAALMPAMTSYTSNMFRVHPLFPFNIGMILLLLVVYTVLLISFIAHRHIPVGGVYLLSTSVCIIVLSIIGAQYEWNRLILPAQPMILIIITQLFTKVSRSDMR